MKQRTYKQSTHSTSKVPRPNVKKPRQQSLFTTKTQLLKAGVAWVPEHGGDVREGRRKIQRPFDPKRFVHLVLKSSKAKGRLSLLHHSHRSKVSQWIYGRAKLHGVHVEKFANVGNHIHVLAKAPTRASFKAFLRSITGPLARAITGAKKGQATGKFWDKPIYSRMIHWGRELHALKAYLGKNVLEACGFGGARLKFRTGAHGKSEAVVIVGFTTKEDEEVFDTLKNRAHDGKNRALKEKHPAPT